jgi:hypothetical protein
MHPCRCIAQTVSFSSKDSQVLSEKKRKQRYALIIFYKSKSKALVVDVKFFFIIYSIQVLCAGLN